MEGHAYFYRNFPAVAVGQIHAAATKLVRAFRTAVDVTAVFVAADALVAAVGHTIPLSGVFGGLGPAGKAAQAATAHDVAHAAAYPHGVGTHNLAFPSADIAQHDLAVVVHALEKVELAEQHPGAAAHALVHLHLTHATGMVNLIHHVLGAVLERLIRHVDGITSALRYVGDPLHQRHLAGTLRRLHALDLAAVALAERGLMSVVQLLGMTEAGLGAGLPFVLVHRHLEIFHVLVLVHVHDLLTVLPEVVAGGVDDGAGVLQHRDDIGDDEGLGK